MATRALSQDRAHGRVVVTWAGITNGDDGAPFEPPVGYKLENIQYIGTIGSGPALKIQGSNEATITTYAELATASALGALVPTAQMRHFRPAAVGGSGTTVSAIALFRQQN